MHAVRAVAPSTMVCSMSPVRDEAADDIGGARQLAVLARMRAKASRGSPRCARPAPRRHRVSGSSAAEQRSAAPTAAQRAGLGNRHEAAGACDEIAHGHDRPADPRAGESGMPRPAPAPATAGRPAVTPRPGARAQAVQIARERRPYVGQRGHALHDGGYLLRLQAERLDAVGGDGRLRPCGCRAR